MEELVLRVEAILRRVRGKKNKESTLYHIGRFTFDTQKQLLTLDGDPNKTTKLTTKENELLGLLCIGLAILLFTTGIDINYPAIYISQAVMGLGFGLFSAPNTNAVMSYVRAAQYNQASGMIAVFRQTEITAV